MALDPRPVDALPSRLWLFAPWRWNTALRTGVILIAIAPFPALITYGVADYTIRSMSAINPVPNQGAMVVAYLACVGAMAVGVIMALVGLCFIARGLIGGRIIREQ